MINNLKKIKKMQKVLLIGIICIFVFAGCGKKNTNNVNVTINNPIETLDLNRRKSKGRGI